MSRSLVVVAHADDETLWCGGWLLENPGTHVCVCSVPRDAQRSVDFFSACAVLGANGFIVGQLETWQNLDAAQVFAASYDDIITHNRLGEYGHRFHIKLHHAMKELNKPLRVFNYGLCPGVPIDVDTKLKALACYSTRPDVLKNQQRRFDLSRECLIEQ